MKYFTIIALAAAAMFLGACAKETAPTTTTTSTASHGYSK
jgi:hypothetical protein